MNSCTPPDMDRACRQNRSPARSSLHRAKSARMAASGARADAAARGASVEARCSAKIAFFESAVMSRLAYTARCAR